MAGVHGVCGRPRGGDSSGSFVSSQGVPEGAPRGSSNTVPSPLRTENPRSGPLFSTPLRGKRGHWRRQIPQISRTISARAATPFFHAAQTVYPVGTIGLPRDRARLRTVTARVVCAQTSFHTGTADEKRVNSERRNVTPMPGLGADSWSAGSAISGAPKKSRKHRGSAKALAISVAAVLAMVGLTTASYSAGVSRGDRAGHERGVAEGYDSGHDVGFSEGRTEGYSSGHREGYDEGAADGYTRGHTAGTKAGYADGFKDGASGGYGRGWTDGCLAVFTALGDDTAAAWSDVDGVFDSSFVSTVDRLSCY